VAASWNDQATVDRYLDRVGVLPARLAGEDALAELAPPAPATVLDLGCGDGRLAALMLDARPSVTRVVAVDASPPMLERARARFEEDARVEVREWDLSVALDPLAEQGPYDVIVSGFAIHHLEDPRKRELFGEVVRLLRPGGWFANLEVVACATPELHAEFLTAIGRPEDDPEDRLVAVDTQLGWMRDAGLGQVDCLWRWRGFALLVGAAVA
jgi:tRNA (cmo5U34)-methyltransferase